MARRLVGVSRVIEHFYKPVTSYIGARDYKGALSSCGRIELKITNAKAEYAYSLRHAEIKRLEYHLVATIRNSKVRCCEKMRSVIVKRTLYIARLLGMDDVRYDERRIISSHDNKSHLVLDVIMSKNNPRLVDKDTYSYLKKLRYMEIICDNGDPLTRTFMYRLVNAGLAEVVDYENGICYAITPEGVDTVVFIRKCREVFESKYVNSCVLSWKPLRPLQVVLGVKPINVV